MILEITTTHFAKTDFCLYKYSILIMYEQNDLYRAKDIAAILKISTRTVQRMRMELINENYLQHYPKNKNKLLVTEKAYK